jgi:NADPH:quinone reductase-like Zn-dependent oxidoreductase
MRAAVIRKTGAAKVMKVETDYPVPDIADGQVLVNNECVAASPTCGCCT